MSGTPTPNPTPTPAPAVPGVPGVPATPPPAAPPATQPETVSRPDGVSDEEWAALGDPGKNALVRERARATKAEQDLAAARAANQPKPNPPAPAPAPAPQGGDTPDLAALIKNAVDAALKPIQDAETQRTAAESAQRVRTAVTTAASDLFHDPSDALVGVDLTQVTDASGNADPAKITAELDKLLAAKPHLGKPVDPRRRAAPGSPIGNGAPPSASLEDRVAAQKKLMEQSR